MRIYANSEKVGEDFNLISDMFIKGEVGFEIKGVSDNTVIL
jgi:hypothetical protein